MTRLMHSRGAWGRPNFNAVLKAEMEALGPHGLPLQQALTQSSVVADAPVLVIPLASHADNGVIEARVAVHFSGLVAGCNCADDPTPVPTTPEVGEFRVTIAANGQTRLALLEG